MDRWLRYLTDRPSESEEEHFLHPSDSLLLPRESKGELGPSRYGIRWHNLGSVAPSGIGGNCEELKRRVEKLADGLLFVVLERVAAASLSGESIAGEEEDFSPG